MVNMCVPKNCLSHSFVHSVIEYPTNTTINRQKLQNPLKWCFFPGKPPFFYALCFQRFYFQRFFFLEVAMLWKWPSDIDEWFEFGRVDQLAVSKPWSLFPHFETVLYRRRGVQLFCEESSLRRKWPSSEDDEISVALM